MLIGMFGCVLPGEGEWQTFPVRDDYKDGADKLLAAIRAKVPASHVAPALESVIASIHKADGAAYTKAMLDGTYTNPAKMCVAGYAYHMLTGKKYFTIRAIFKEGEIVTNCTDSDAKTPAEYNTAFEQLDDVKKLMDIQKVLLEQKFPELKTAKSVDERNRVQLAVNVQNAAKLLAANPGHVFIFETVAEALLAQALFYPMAEPKIPNCGVVEPGGKYNARVIRDDFKMDIIKITPRKVR